MTDNGAENNTAVGAFSHEAHPGMIPLNDLVQQAMLSAERQTIDLVASKLAYARKVAADADSEVQRLDTLLRECKAELERLEGDDAD